MNRKPREPPIDDERARPNETFLQRLHRRKLEARATLEPPRSDPTDKAATVAKTDTGTGLTDADMPSIDSLSVDSDFRGFLSDTVSEPLRRAALRKLFHDPRFNVIDEMDDYVEDFRTFEAMGDLITADMRHQLEIEAKRLAERLDNGTPTGHTVTDSADRPDAPGAAPAADPHVATDPHESSSDDPPKEA